jgi:hypothetical protein
VASTEQGENLHLDKQWSHWISSIPTISCYYLPALLPHPLADLSDLGRCLHLQLSPDHFDLSPPTLKLSPVMNLLHQPLDHPVPQPSPQLSEDSVPQWLPPAQSSRTPSQALQLPQWPIQHPLLVLNKDPCILILRQEFLDFVSGC